MHTNEAAMSIYNDIIRKGRLRMSPKVISEHFEVSKYIARKVIQIFREHKKVKYEVWVDEGCKGNCTTESMSYCECEPPSPPMGVWVIVQ